MTKRQAGPQGLATPRAASATSGDVARLDLRGRVEHWGGGVVKVELTDRERKLFSAVAHAAARQLIDDVLSRDPSGLSDDAVRLLAVLAIPRTGRALWESLTAGAHGHGSRTTTFRLHRRSALVWAHLLLEPIAGRNEWARLSRATRYALAAIAGRLVLVSFAHRGGRRPPSVDTDEAVRLLEAARRRGAGAIKATAARLACDERAIGRALKRHGRERSALGRTRALLERVSAWGLQSAAPLRPAESNSAQDLSD